jgi:hypothetical protein
MAGNIASRADQEQETNNMRTNEEIKALRDLLALAVGAMHEAENQYMQKMAHVTLLRAKIEDLLEEPHE